MATLYTDDLSLPKELAQMSHHIPFVQRSDHKSVNWLNAEQTTYTHYTMEEKSPYSLKMLQSYYQYQYEYEYNNNNDIL